MTEKIGCVQHDCDECKARLAQPEQESASIIQAVTDPENQPSQYGTVTLDYHFAKLKEWEDRFEKLSDRALAQPEERNFCPRCGKRTADLTLVHTCTPPIAADPKAFHGFPSGSVSTPNAGGKCVTDGETSPTHFMNSTKTVAVATDTYWLPIDKDTPRSAKLQLLSIGGVAQYGTLSGDVSFYTHWCPLPKKPK